MSRLSCFTWILASVLSFYAKDVSAQAIGQEGFINSQGVPIHYVTAGKGPLLVMLHGFPDFHRSWRHQIFELAKHFQVVAPDLRGFNKSGKPDGVSNYKMDKLTGDVAALLRHFNQEKIILVGHDWGGAIAWNFAMNHPDKVERLVILNLPHPSGLSRELADNPEQQKASQYARDFQKPEAAKLVKPEALAGYVRNPGERALYVEALKLSSMEGMLNYYKANYPRPPYKPLENTSRVKCPVLMFHGLDDKALLPEGLNNTWKWIDGDLTLVTVPGAGHWVHWDKPELVTARMLSWLTNK
jgi:pimeloyl-ACP methyl ester carboxylesterase